MNQQQKANGMEWSLRCRDNPKTAWVWFSCGKTSKWSRTRNDWRSFFEFGSLEMPWTIRPEIVPISFVGLTLLLIFFKTQTKEFARHRPNPNESIKQLRTTRTSTREDWGTQKRPSKHFLGARCQKARRIGTNHQKLPGHWRPGIRSPRFPDYSGLSAGYSSKWASSSLTDSCFGECMWIEWNWHCVSRSNWQRKQESSKPLWFGWRKSWRNWSKCKWFPQKSKCTEWLCWCRLWWLRICKLSSENS